MNGYKERIGELIQDTRLQRGMTQQDLADALGTSQSAINRIERGGQNVSLEMLARIGDVLSSEIVSLSQAGTLNFKIRGGKKLSGSIAVKASKNAAVGILCAALLNRGTTTIKYVPKIEEVNRIIEVLSSIGVKTRWLNDDKDLEIKPPAKLKLENIDEEAARKTRTIIMFLGPLLHTAKSFKLPYAGGCNLGKRTVEPHLAGLKYFGLDVVAANSGFYEANVKKTCSSTSKNSIGARLIVISDFVTTAAAIKLIASIGSSLGYTSTSLLIAFRPVILSVVVPMPSIFTPSFCRNKHKSCTI